MMSLSKIIQNGYKSSKNGFRKDNSTINIKKSYYNKRNTRFYSNEVKETQPESMIRRVYNYVSRRNYRYAVGGTVIVGLALLSEISEMRSIDNIENELSKEHEKVEHLNSLLFSAHMYLRDYKATRRFKNVQKLCDTLTNILFNCPFQDIMPRVYALICLSLLCEHSKSAKDYIVKNLDFVKLSKFVSEYGASEDDVKSLRNLQGSTNNPSSKLSKKVLIRRYYERLLYHICEDQEAHPQLIRANIVPLAKSLIDDENGEYLFAAQYLKHLSNSERGSRELMREDFIPLVHSKLFSKDEFLPEWGSQGSILSESTYLKAQDFLINMTKKYASDIEKRYPEIYNHLDELSNKSYRPFEEAVSTIRAMTNAKYILMATAIGMAYGSLRTLIHNYRFPSFKRAVIRKGALPAAAATSLAIFATMVYDSSYKIIWSDERLHVLLRLLFVSGSLGYFYLIGSKAPYSVVPYAIIYGLRSRENDEFDVESLRKGQEFRNMYKKKEGENK